MQGPSPLPGTPVLTPEGWLREREGLPFPRSLQCLGTGRGSPSHKPWAGVGWLGLLERTSDSSWWAGWQWLSLRPAGPREVLTWHKGSGSTTRPLSMNQLNQSTEKLTQTHRRPLGGTCLGLRLQGTATLTLVLGDELQPLPGEPSGGSICLPLLIFPLLANLLTGLMACALSVLPGFIYQVLIVLLGCSSSGWARMGHKMTSPGTLPWRNLRFHRARRGVSGS